MGLDGAARSAGSIDARGLVDGVVFVVGHYGCGVGVEVRWREAEVDGSQRNNLLSGWPLSIHPAMALDQGEAPDVAAMLTVSPGSDGGSVLTMRVADAEQQPPDLGKQQATAKVSWTQSR